MKRTITLIKPDGADEVLHSDRRVTYPMRHATSHYWDFKGNQIAEQTFDGRYTYIYYYEFRISTAMPLSFSSEAPDLHLCYPLKSTGDQISVRENETDFRLDIEQERAFYLYLPATAITLELPVGHHILMGITLDAGLFRPHLERTFDFVMPLVFAKRTGLQKAMMSIAFKIGPLTYCEILNLFKRINPRVMDNEYLLVHHQIFLINLSRLKIITETTKVDSTLVLVEQAREYLQLTISKFGAQARIKDIANSLQVDSDKLCRLHQKYYQCSLLDYRNQLLLEIIVLQLDNYPNQFAALAIELSFSGHSELNRFFKKMTGYSLNQYKNLK